MARRRGGEVTWIEGCPRDIIQGGCMGKHGFWVWRKRRVEREEGAPESFRGTIREALNSHLRWEMKRRFLWRSRRR
jgi:hypothetical protein